MLLFIKQRRRNEICNKKCPYKEKIDDEQIEYYPPDYGCYLWIFDKKTALQRNTG